MIPVTTLDTHQDDLEVTGIDDTTNKILLTAHGEIQFAQQDGYDTYTFETIELTPELAEQVGEDLLHQADRLTE